jgi:hypothetical protein
LGGGNKNGVWQGKPNVTDHFYNLVVKGSVIFKMILGNWHILNVDWIHLD